MRELPDDIARRLKDGGRDLTILVLRTGAFGDVLRTLPALRALRAGLRHARILWVVEDRWARILEGHPDLDGTVIFPRSSWRPMLRAPRAWPRLAHEILRWAQKLRRSDADLALDFHGNLRSGLVGVVSGAPVRLGYEGHQQKEGNRWLTTHRIATGARRTSRVERNLLLVRALGIAEPPPPGGGGLAEDRVALRESREIARHLVGEGEAFAVLSPGASKGQAYKKPPTALLIAAAERLAGAGVHCLVVYGPGEEDDAGKVVRGAPGAARLAPPTDLAVLASLLRLATLFVGGDSGPLHLACAVGCPVVGLYGPTDPIVNAPWAVPHVALAPPGREYTGIKRLDREGGGFDGLEPEMVRDAVVAVLARTARRDDASRRAP